MVPPQPGSPNPYHRTARSSQCAVGPSEFSDQPACGHGDEQLGRTTLAADRLDGLDNGIALDELPERTRRASSEEVHNWRGMRGGIKYSLLLNSRDRIRRA